MLLRGYNNKTLPKQQLLKAHLSWTFGYQLRPPAGNSEPFPQVIPGHSPSPLQQSLCLGYIVTLLNQVSKPLHSVCEASSKLVSGAWTLGKGM